MAGMAFFQFTLNVDCTSIACPETIYISTWHTGSHCQVGKVAYFLCSAQKESKGSVGLNKNVAAYVFMSRGKVSKNLYDMITVMIYRIQKWE
ncbi:hypothetical protein THAOC_03218 [Thalassiosira oceanica]|uniref:Uncharacterized protein n=1 Tax=Thalassiosira oceanica TaxID=159749 RepID=K0T8J0_THAOC|nr:hypothetical protein THAOC_03218 [Thalassiosira oceanica]|mmetsp:Transcript_29588/g.70298  ORF Transcript_29588/g.70298 Transcript_29588/m.70298 type:complete len:92 (+) Transcript_29588:1458-1733(+)|eukprot:EJK75073.1 hypothetical protein THAOC_03218 [Thalassiosira oceanica]